MTQGLLLFWGTVLALSEFGKLLGSPSLSFSQLYTMRGLEVTKKHHLTEGDCCLRLGSWDSYEVKMKLPKAHTLGPAPPHFRARGHFWLLFHKIT